MPEQFRAALGPALAGGGSWEGAPRLVEVAPEAVRLNGAALADPIDFDRRAAALRGGQRITLDISRAGARRQVTAALPPLAREQIPGVEFLYTHVVNPRGPRQRAILTRPAGAAGRLPAVRASSASIRCARAPPRRPTSTSPSAREPMPRLRCR